MLTPIAKVSGHGAYNPNVVASVDHKVSVPTSLSKDEEAYFSNSAHKFAQFDGIAKTRNEAKKSLPAILATINSQIGNDQNKLIDLATAINAITILCRKRETTSSYKQNHTDISGMNLIAHLVDKFSFSQAMAKNIFLLCVHTGSSQLGGWFGTRYKTASAETLYSNIWNKLTKDNQSKVITDDQMDRVIGTSKRTLTPSEMIDNFNLRNEYYNSGCDEEVYASKRVHDKKAEGLLNKIREISAIPMLNELVDNYIQSHKPNAILVIPKDLNKAFWAEFGKKSDFYDKIKRNFSVVHVYKNMSDGAVDYEEVSISPKRKDSAAKMYSDL